jgi:hypothetical protein
MVAFTVVVLPPRQDEPVMVPLLEEEELLDDELLDEELELEELLLDEDELDDELEELLDDELLELLDDELEPPPEPVQVGRMKLPSCVPCRPKLVLWPGLRACQLQQLVAVTVIVGTLMPGV